MNWTTDGLPLWIAAWLLAAWAVPRAWQQHAGIGLTAAFLAWADWRGLAAIGAAGGAVAILLRHGPPTRATYGLAVGTIAGGFIALKAGHRVDVSDPAVLGAAFATLRLIALLTDIHLGRVRLRSQTDYWSHLLFLPTVIAGPLAPIDQLQRDAQRRRWDAGLAAAGLERILYGYVKIVVCAGWVSYKLSFVDTSTWNPSLSAWYLCAFYGWDLYFTFAGYSDIAIGLALATGYHLPENFAFPFAARNIQDFWRRWHASLSTWCRSHVTEPVLAGTRNTVLAIIASMLVLGLWHELSPRYCAWGLFHGLGITAFLGFRRWRGQPRQRGRIATWTTTLVAVLLTQAFVIMSFAFTRSPDLATAGWLIARMLGIH